MLKQLREQALLHSCEHAIDHTIEYKDLVTSVEPSNKHLSDMVMSYQVYRVSDLFLHMQNDCPKRKKVCPYCVIEFENTDECYDHLKVDC